ncbi:hypothetical protein [Pseudothioclava arenosa]|nr:hypothetical protein [Pseudothioclava arenosa]
MLRALPGRANLLRVRAQCLAVETLVRLEVPKRTHLIRMILEDGKVVEDGLLMPSLQPHFLSDDQEGFALAERIVSGGASEYLPTVYVSAIDDDRWALDVRAIRALARDLAGVAHVVCEPSREFSFRLRDQVDGENVYNGTLGIAVPGGGFAHRAYLGRAIPDAKALVARVKSAAVDIRSQMPKVGGWDWLDFQDAILRHQREIDKNRLSAEENEKLWNDELALKDARIQELEAELHDARNTPLQAPASAAGNGMLLSMLKPEVYSGEFSDRVRAALEFCLERGADSGWDKRSLAVFEEIVGALTPSPALNELREDLRRATRDPARLNAELRKLLARHGFEFKSDNKHSRMEPRPEYVGLESVTLMKTPGDHRGLMNLCSQIEANLGLTRLKKMG